MSSLLRLTTIYRAIYRVAELGDGWEGVILRTEVYFGMFCRLIELLAHLNSL